MKHGYILTVIVLLSILAGSCKKVIDLDLKNASPQLVIEANLTDLAGPQYVSITKSVPIDNTNNFPEVSGAKVSVTDSLGTNRAFVEQSPGNYYSDSFIGRPNRKYTLHVTLNGKTYTATSTMPEKVNADSVALSVQYFGTQTVKTIIVYYQDPLPITNQYRFVLTINGTQVKRIFAYNDFLNNGKAVQQLLYEDDIKLQRGDHVDIDMQCIDQNMYNYWYTFSIQQGNEFNSVTPSNPIGNFNDPNVLGYFSAHTFQRKSIIIP